MRSTDTQSSPAQVAVTRSRADHGRTEARLTAAGRAAGVSVGVVVGRREGTRPGVGVVAHDNQGDALAQRTGVWCAQQPGIHAARVEYVPARQAPLQVARSVLVQAHSALVGVGGRRCRRRDVVRVLLLGVQHAHADELAQRLTHGQGAAAAGRRGSPRGNAHAGANAPAAVGGARQARRRRPRRRASE